MSGWLLLAIAVAGGVGSALRYVVDTLVNARSRLRFPVGTNVVNATGSFALGVVAGLVATQAWSGDLGWILGTGLVGGYTTFSTASLQTVELLLEGRRGAAVVNGVVLLLVNVGVAGIGLLLGALIGG